ncbi:MAG: T9SS type A sorting domain-containing protein [Candidatus Kapaibacterium sp.]
MKTILTLFLFVLSATMVYAQVTWQKTGMTTGTFPSLKVSTTGVLYAGDATGSIHRSSDNGMTWTKGSIGMPLGIIDIEISPDGRSLFASTSVLSGEGGNGVYTSTDDGATWQHLPVTAGVTARDIIFKGNVMYVSTKDAGLVKSTDNGVSWQPASAMVTEKNIGAFAITSNGSLLIGVKGGNGVYRSTDDGTTWTLTSMPQTTRVYSLTVAPNGVVFAGTHEQKDGVYRSNDDGVNWQKVPAFSSSVSYSINGTATSDGRIFIGAMNLGIYVSSDGGATWTLTTDGLQTLVGFKIAEGKDGTVYATSFDGIYKTAKATGVTETTSEMNDLQVQAYPNPTSNHMTFDVTMQAAGKADLRVYDMLHHEVALVWNDEFSSGRTRTEFDTSVLPEGMYYYTLTSGTRREIGRMVVVR